MSAQKCTVILLIILCMGISAVLASPDLFVNVPDIPIPTAAPPASWGIIPSNVIKNIQPISTQPGFEDGKNSETGIDKIINLSETDSGPPGAAGDTILVSKSTAGAPGDVYGSYYNSISADGRYIAFESYATNLVSGDTNSQTDIFVHDQTTGKTTRVSVDSSGKQAVGGSFWLGSCDPSISPDGRYVAFESYATNLVSGDTNNQCDIFVHDRATGVTTRVNVDSSGIQAFGGGSDDPSISLNGRYVAFESEAINLVPGDTNENSDIFVHDRTTGKTTRVSVDSYGSQVVGYSYHPSISSDGRYVAFNSRAPNLVTGDTNRIPDIFVHDRKTGKTTRVSVNSSGKQALKGDSFRTSISADGRYVAFDSYAANLVSGDTNNQMDIFVHDRTTRKTTRVSISSTGAQATGGSSSYPSISPDGQYVAFQSDASNLVSGDTNKNTDIFVHDRTTGITTRGSVSSTGAQATGGSSNEPSISSNGKFVSFYSKANNLVSGDKNNINDVFVHKMDSKSSYTKIGYFRPSTHTWYIDYNGNGAYGSGDKTYTKCGTKTDIPVTGDWNGDGKTEIGYFRPSTHTWYIDYNGNGAYGTGDRTYTKCGTKNDIPVTGDWNGNGKTEIGYFRPSTHTWYIDYNGNGVYGTGDRTYTKCGTKNDIPVTGDWNGDSKTDIGYFRPSTHTWYIDYSGNGAYGTGDRTYTKCGTKNDIPVTGDWNGNGKTDIGFFRPSTHTWYIDYNGNGAYGTGDRTYTKCGTKNDIPVTGQWSALTGFASIQSVITIETQSQEQKFQVPIVTGPVSVIPGMDIRYKNNSAIRQVIL